MFMRLMVFCQFPGLIPSSSSYTRKLMTTNRAMDSENEVFTNGEKASMFLVRHLLYNQFDFEMITPGNLERECHEEVCSYEEAKEIFGEHDKTIAFWKDYIEKGPHSSSDRSQKIDAIGLLTGLVAAGVFLVILAFLGYYFFTNRYRSRRDPSSSRIWRNSGSLISRRQDDVSLSPISLPLSVEVCSPPSYEQAISLATAVYDVPPPPYPGITKELKTLKKSLSLPNPQAL
uniref:Transmembrane gamma-carboxyglutamic acid protein 4 n=1 Tax=Geotrypetes seraphini TaxID=260995 RepID=A0A6P8PKX9_GEOSA|nr:transmembrane gamma-carboxyglutamic acid protein 4 [Geotrypetes seraphini]XP_033784565.1 transmembrane gamma-carboxyglutamic acid protein 4 [Geotrypetes seraphini]